MTELKLIAMDTSKHVFSLHGVNERGEVVLRRELRRQQLAAFFRKLPPTEIVLEACGSSHHWGRTLAALGHRVQLIAPQYVKPFVKRGKNDRIDAEAISEAARVPTCASAKPGSRPRSGRAMILSVELLVKQHTQLVKRAARACFGFGGSRQGHGTCQGLLERIAADPAVLRPGEGEEFVELGELDHAETADEAGGARPQTGGVAQGQPAQPATGGGAGDRADRGADAGPDGRCIAVPLGKALRRLARPDAEAEFDRRQTAAGRDLAPGQ